MPYERMEFNIDTVGWVPADQRNDYPGLQELGIRVFGVGKTGLIEVMYADIPGQSWNQNRLNKFAERAQQLLDHRIPLDDPELADDPHGINGTDPGLPWFFWDSGDLVAREYIIRNPAFVLGRLVWEMVRARSLQ